MQNCNLKFKINNKIVKLFKILFLSIIVVSVSACGVVDDSGGSQKMNVRIKDLVIIADVPKTDQEYAKGLGGRESLGENEGMLFVYKKKIPEFWMKGMLISIDIIWISDGKIVDFSENLPLPSDDNLPRFSPKEPIDYVLEVRAGYVADHGLRIGDKVTIDSL